MFRGMNNKKLLFVAPALGYGGAEKNFLGVANFAAENGYEVYLLTEKGSKDARHVSEKIIRYSLRVSDKKNTILRLVNCVAEVVRYIRRIKPAVIISFIDLWRTACVIAGKLTGVKCIVSERADPYSRHGRHDKVIFSIFSMADGFVFQTEQAKAFFNARVQKKGVVIPNPVFDEDVLSPYDGEKKDIIVSIARLDLKQKRQDVLIKAFSMLADAFPAYQLYLYGSGPDEESIRKMIEDSGCSDRICLCGVTNNVHRALGEAKVMALSSDYEGIPNAIIESMCVGVPVVSTKCSPGGAELLIENGVNGLLVEQGDVTGMAKAIANLLEDENLSKRIIENGFSVKERFAEKEVLKRWITYIQQVQHSH